MIRLTENSRAWIGRLAAASLLFILIAAATRPLWSSGQFFYSDDALLHLFRVFAFDRALRQGIVYPRWLPDLASGYGYPIFNYYPPLAAYLVESLHLFGLGFGAAIKGAFVGIVAAAAVGAYAMGTEVLRGEKLKAALGLFTAVAYISFSYFLINIYQRGALAEALAAAILPWLVWSLHRALTRPSVGSLVLVALFLAALLLAHSLTLFMVAPVLGLYALLEWSHPAAQPTSPARPSHCERSEAVSARRAAPGDCFAAPAMTSTRRFSRAIAAAATRSRGLLLLAGSAILGIGLGAIYAFPFVAELPLVKMGRGIPEIQGYFQTPIHFQTLFTLIQSSWAYRYSAAPFALGLVPAVLGLAATGAALAARGRVEARRTVLFCGAVAFAAALAMLESSREVWQRLPAATMVQYPWRVSVLIGLCLSLVVGSFPLALFKMPLLGRLGSVLSVRVGSRATQALQVAIILVCSGALLWAALARLSPQPVFMPGEPTLGQLARFEEISGFIGTTTFGEYLPAAVQSERGGIRAAPREAARRSPSADVELLAYGPTEQAFAISARETVSVSLRALAFPDWRAAVDGQPATVYPSTSMGLVTVDVPPGNHRVVLSLGDTPARQVGGVISGASALVLLALVLLMTRRREPELAPVLVALTIALAVLLPPTALALRAPPSNPQSTQADFAPGLKLIGLRVQDARFESQAWHVPDPPSVLHFQVYWQVKQSLPDRPITWQLRDGEGRVRAERKQLARYGTGAMSDWIPNEVVEDHYDLPLRQATPAGRYALFGAYGDAGNDVSLGTVQRERDYRPTVTKEEIANRLNAQLGDDIRLLGYDLPRVLQPGTRFPMTLWWRADRDILQDYLGVIELLDVNGRVAASPRYEGTQIDGLNPTSLWIPGQVVSDRRVLYLPDNLRPGLYYWAAGMRRFPNQEPLEVTTEAGSQPGDVVVLREVKVPMNAPATHPEHPLYVSVGPTIGLLGYDLTVTDARGNLTRQKDSQTPVRLSARPGQSLTVRLFWQATAKVGADYKVFVHVADEKGEIQIQQDQSPDEWRYPTHIWDAGERVVDSHRLPLDNLPPGRYAIRVGMYESASGERLVLRDSSGAELGDRQAEIALLEVVVP